MAFVFDEAWINNGQLVVASDTVKPPGQGLGKGADRVRHSAYIEGCLLYTSPSPRDGLLSRMPSSA